MAWIDDTNTKVIAVAQDIIAQGWRPEEIHFQHSHISRAQVHAALGFYYDHELEMDAIMPGSLPGLEKLRAQAGESPIRTHLFQAAPPAPGLPAAFAMSLSKRLLETWPSGFILFTVSAAD